MRPNLAWASANPTATPGAAMEAAPIWNSCLVSPKSAITPRKSISEGGELAFRRLDEEVQEMRPPVGVPDHQEAPAEEGGEDGFGDAGGQRPGDHSIDDATPGAQGMGGGVSGDLVASGDCEFGHEAGYGD